MRTGRSVACAVRVAAALVGAAVAGEARASRAEIRIRLECPALEALARAALEARARADLSASGVGGGEAFVRCDSRAATIAWQPESGAPRARTMPLQGHAPEVDAILATLHALSSEATPTAAPVDDAPPPLAEGFGPPPEQEGTSVEARRSPIAPSLAIGLDFELWQGQVASALGAHAGVRLARPGSSWAALLLGGFLWGIGAADGVRVRALDAQMILEFAPRSFRLGLGADARVLITDWGSTVQYGSTLGAICSTRYEVAIGHLAISAGPQVEWLARSVIVEVAGNDVFRLPTLVGGLSVDADFEP